MAITATPFPGIPAPYRLIDSALTKERLLASQDIAPLQVVDAEGLEILEGSKNESMDPIVLLVERARKPEWRTLGIKNLLYLIQGPPRNPRMRSTVLKMLEAVEQWLNTSDFDEEGVTHALFPEPV